MTAEITRAGFDCAENRSDHLCALAGLRVVKNQTVTGKTADRMAATADATLKAAEMAAHYAGHEVCLGKRACEVALAEPAPIG